MRLDFLKKSLAGLQRLLPRCSRTARTERLGGKESDKWDHHDAIITTIFTLIKAPAVHESLKRIEGLPSTTVAQSTLTAAAMNSSRCRRPARWTTRHSPQLRCGWARSSQCSYSKESNKITIKLCILTWKTHWAEIVCSSIFHVRVHAAVAERFKKATLIAKLPVFFCFFG